MSTSSASAKQADIAVQRLRNARRFTFSPKAPPPPPPGDPEAKEPPELPEADRPPHPVYGNITFTLRRPAEIDMPSFSRFNAAATVDHIVDWAGVTEEHLFGRGIGNTSPVPFDPVVAKDWLCGDAADVLVQIYGALVAATATWLQQREAAAKN
jgi:hypothetical protein